MVAMNAKLPGASHIFTQLNFLHRPGPSHGTGEINRSMGPMGSVRVRTCFPLSTNMIADQVHNVHSINDCFPSQYEKVGKYSCLMKTVKQDNSSIL